jgi:hypothetical protein
VRVVTCDAGHLALLQTSGLSKAISLLHNLQPVVITCTRFMIKRQRIVRQRLAGPIGEGSTYSAFGCAWTGAGPASCKMHVIAAHTPASPSRTEAALSDSN